MGPSGPDKGFLLHLTWFALWQRLGLGASSSDRWSAAKTVGGGGSPIGPIQRPRQLEVWPLPTDPLQLPGLQRRSQVEQVRPVAPPGLHRPGKVSVGPGLLPASAAPCCSSPPAGSLGNGLPSSLMVRLTVASHRRLHHLPWQQSSLLARRAQRHALLKAGGFTDPMATSTVVRT